MDQESLAKSIATSSQVLRWHKCGAAQHFNKQSYNLRAIYSFLICTKTTKLLCWYSNCKVLLAVMYTTSYL